MVNTNGQKASSPHLTPLLFLMGETIKEKLFLANMGVHILTWLLHALVRLTVTVAFFQHHITKKKKKVEKKVESWTKFVSYIQLYVHIILLVMKYVHALW